jgi:hypothetical protein
MTEPEITEAIGRVHATLLDEIPSFQKWTTTEIRESLEWAVTVLNACNPKNKLSHNLATAPSHWDDCLVEGAAGHLLSITASAVKESNPDIAHKCTIFAKNHETEFHPWAKRVTAVRPFSR